MKLPFGLDRLFQDNDEDNTTVTKKSTTIAPEAKIEEAPLKVQPVQTEPPYDPDEELFDTLQTILENQFTDRDKIDTIVQMLQANATMVSTLVKVLSNGSGGFNPSGVSAEDANDMKIVITTQRKVITTILQIPVLDDATREAIGKALIEMPEWDVLESAEKRLRERELNRNTLNNLQKEAQKEQG